MAKFTWGALGRRIEHIDDTNSKTKRNYFDGVNDVYEFDDGGDPLRYFVHGVSYIDERLAMVNCYETTDTTDDRPYYYVLDRMYNVRMIVDRAGAIIERYAYDPYGKPLIRESGGRGDMQDFGTITSGDNFRHNSTLTATIWDARADMDDDGDVDSNDTTLYNAAVVAWSYQPTVAQAFSDVGNPYMFQGVPHFAIDTSSSATAVKFPLNHHRARFAEPVTGWWVTRDPKYYINSIRREFLGGTRRNACELYLLIESNPMIGFDPNGTTILYGSGDQEGISEALASLMLCLDELAHLIQRLIDSPLDHTIIPDIGQGHPGTDPDTTNPEGDADSTRIYWDPNDNTDYYWEHCCPGTTVCPMAILAHELSHSLAFDSGQEPDHHVAVYYENLARACCGDPPRTDLYCWGIKLYD